MRKMPENPRITHVMYHGNCYDGLTAAWIAWMAGVQRENMFPLSHGSEALAGLYLPKDAKVLMTDFSLPLAELQKMRESVDTLIVLDHHKTAEADLQGLDWAYFDMNESGASLTWDFFNPSQRRPKLVQYIKEHDLWKFELPYSTLVRSFIRSYDMTIENLSYLSTVLSQNFNRVIVEGEGIQRAMDAAVEMMCSQAIVGEIEGYRVPIANATIYFSEVGSRLLELYHDAPFAAYYMDRSDGVRQWGLRSRPGFDCSEIAKTFGGGGHAQAAGFTTKPTRVAPTPLNLKHEK